MRDGFYSTAKKVLQVLGNVGRDQQINITDRRIGLGLRLQEQIGDNVIRHGAFKGMAIDPLSSWGVADYASIVLGMYEAEVSSFFFISKR